MSTRLWAGLFLLSSGQLAASWLAGGCNEPTSGLLHSGRPLHELGVQFHRAGAPAFLPVFREVFTAFGPEVTVRVVVGDEEDRELFEAAVSDWFPAGAGPTFTYAVAGRPITSWHRDRLQVLEDGTLVAPPRPMDGPESRVHDWSVPWALGEHLNRPVRVSDYRFDGGDLLASATHTFAATPLLERNPGWTREKLVDALERDFGRDVVWIGETGPVPNHHLGMFLTPLPDGRVVVGDAELGRSSLSADEDLYGFELADDTSTASRVADELIQAGFEVVRMPLLPTTTDFAWFSYNNVLLDQRQDGLHVVLPVYGLSVDEVAIQAWRGLGATVHPVEVREIFGFGGSVRCLTAPLS